MVHYLYHRDAKVSKRIQLANNMEERAMEADANAWEKDFAPSSELRKWYGHDPERYEEFRERYLAELDANPKAAEFAGKMAASEGTVTLLFGAKDAEHSNAAVLKDWLTS